MVNGHAYQYNHVVDINFHVYSLIIIFRSQPLTNERTNDPYERLGQVVTGPRSPSHQPSDADGNREERMPRDQERPPGKIVVDSEVNIRKRFPLFPIRDIKIRS